MKEAGTQESTSSQRAASTLDWLAFLDRACAEALTETGKARLARLESPERWAPEIANARLLQQETQEIAALLDREALWGPLASLADPAPALERLTRGSVLELSELVLLRKWLYAVDSWATTPREEIRGELFRKALAALPDPYAPLQPLDRILTPEGELSERASPRLATLYAELRNLRREIGASLDHLMKSFAQRGVLQENFTDVRDGRVVVPVKISCQGEVDGIVYEASASRQTVFIEPSEVAPLNNRLRQRQNDILQETFRILTEVSKELHPLAPELLLGVEILTHWDAAQARARLGRRYAGKPIQVTEERTFRLEQTAHPLLWWTLPPERIVRNEIDFGEPVRTLLITGPNTGGKTVLLKTLGLAGICARTGFPFPAIESPRVPFFRTFFADLGDSQSIERHLSSFSGHVLRFKEILDDVTDQSLVLIDELNSATDPEEGAALGRAFLETVMGRNALIVTTTHDPSLKALSLSDERILTASMAFDESSRAPTYVLQLGIPGRSRALETAERLGIPAPVIELARAYLSRDHVEFERLLSKLEGDSREAARARKEAVTLREEAARLQKEWTERTEASVKDMLDRTRQKLRRILEQAQDEVRSSVRKLDEVRNRRELEESRARISESAESASRGLEKALEEEAPEIAGLLARTGDATGAKPAGPRPGEAVFEPGMRVRVPKWKSTGTVLGLQGSRIKVAMGNLQVAVPPSELEPLDPAGTKPAGRAHVAATDAAVSRELDLRGTRLDEAMMELERYLDQAYRSGAAQVTIVHGLGTGALREGTRRILARLPYVKEFRDGGAGHGGTGATLVEFER
ncbi:MAG: Smr/MutS family protein [Oligoflexia bacterium]|nr:Smr/MutS family protein [Oligoflexia bacterium]